jgi:hypothetical protein
MGRAYLTTLQTIGTQLPINGAEIVIERNGARAASFGASFADDAFTLAHHNLRFTAYSLRITAPRAIQGAAFHE